MNRKKRTLAIVAVLVVLLIVLSCWPIYRQIRQDRLNRALIAAIHHGDTPTALALLTSGANPNSRDDPPDMRPIWQEISDILHGKHLPPSEAPTALLLALETFRDSDSSVLPLQPALIKGLVDRGADVHVTDENGCPLVFLAIALHADDSPSDRVKVVRCLLDRGADVNAIGTFNISPLFFAIGLQDEDLVRLLLDRGANAYELDSDGKRAGTALMFAADKGDTKIVRLLLSRHPDITFKRATGETALSMARKAGHQDIVRLLKQAGEKE